MMTCEQITRRASDFIERKLRLGERLKILAHIAMCRGCRTYIAQLSRTMLGLRTLPQPVAAPPRQDLLEHFRRHLPPKLE